MAAACRIVRSASTKPAETLPGSAVQQEVRMLITYNKPVTFGRNGTARNLNCTGIDFFEENQSWTSAPVAELDIQLPFAQQDVVFELDATPFVIPEVVAAQKVFIFVGGMFVGYCSLTDHDLRTFPVNRNVISGRAARLSLVIPTATSPSSLRMGEDVRELGICLFSITFRTGT
jgi:hypothetical protein